jgi:hypothetical protein
MSEPYWTDPEYRVHEASQDERTELLREQLIAKRASIRVAMTLGMTPDQVEFLVDDFWNPLREMALDRETVDIVLGVLILGLCGEEEAEARCILRGLERL